MKSRRLISCLLIGWTAGSVFLTPVFGQTPVRVGHPRLFGPVLQKEKQSPSKLILKVRKLNAGFRQRLAQSGTDIDWMNTVKTTVLLAYVDPGEARVFRASELLKKIDHPLPSDDYRILQQLEGLVYLYDLGFSLLKDSERQDVLSKMKVRLDWLEEANLLSSENYGGSHFSYANRISAFAAIATQGEAEWSADLLAKTMNNQVEGFWPFYQQVAGQDGGFHMGWEYSRYYLWEMVEFFLVWRNATGEDLFLKHRWVEKVGVFLMQGLRGDGTYWGAGDNHSRSLKGTDHQLFSALAREYQNGYARGVSEQSPLENSEDEWNDLLADLMGSEKAMPDLKPLAELPAVARFSGVGVHTFREVGDKDVLSAVFRSSPTYFFNHSHRDSNSFEIWYKGDLAVDSGYYDAYGSSHWFNYYIRTIAHNTVLIFDPEEKLADWDKIESNDGGQRFSQSPHEQPYDVQDLENPAFHIGKSTLLEDNANYSLAVGDATKAYSPHKCELFKRYFLFLRKVEGWAHPVIVVYDRVVSTQDSFDKIWLLHSIHKPEIKEREITIQNGGGKLRAVVVKPADFDLRTVGGPGHEFEVNGVNYAPNTKKKKDLETWAGAWRTELRQRKISKDAEFLTVLFPADKEQADFPAVESAEGGVRIGQWDIRADENGLSVKQYA